MTLSILSPQFQTKGKKTPTTKWSWMMLPVTLAVSSLGMVSNSCRYCIIYQITLNIKISWKTSLSKFVFLAQNIMVVKRKKKYLINLSLLDKQIQSFTSGTGSGGLCSLSQLYSWASSLSEGPEFFLLALNLSNVADDTFLKLILQVSLRIKNTEKLSSFL